MLTSSPSSKRSSGCSSAWDCPPAPPGPPKDWRCWSSAHLRLQRLRPVETTPGWLQAFAAHQPLTVMVDAVRALTQGHAAEALLGHGAGFYVVQVPGLGGRHSGRVRAPGRGPLPARPIQQLRSPRRNQCTGRQQSTFPRLDLPRTASSYRPIRSRPSAYRQAVSTRYGTR
jgi:hypothetical protein